MKYHSIVLFIVIIFIGSCTNDNGNGEEPGNFQDLAIFFVNDPHGQLDNFAKLKHLVDEERAHSNVILACSGDIFSGNPVVDNYPEKGYPMIDMMNKTGFDIAVLGNHEFDYGDEVLSDRINQAKFQWVCANVDVSNTNIPEPDPFQTINIDGLNITFLGLVETNGKDNATIPSTHPWKVKDITFTRPENVVTQYSSTKEQENADLFIALTHLGHSGYGGTLGDFQLAQQYPYFDIILGGHSHARIDTTVNKIPIFQAGSNLKYVGKVKLSIKDKKIESYSYELIYLNNYIEFDSELKAVIDDYNDLPYLKEKIGYSQRNHNANQVGCFFTDALRGTMDVDVTFQNTGGIRSGLAEGDITNREVFEIDPFNNGTVKYNMSVAKIKEFLIGTGSGFYYSGIRIEQSGKDIRIKDLSGNILDDDTILSIGINDYIPAVHDDYFPQDGEIQSLTSAESLIYYLENINSDVNYLSCDHYFRYQ